MNASDEVSQERVEHVVLRPTADVARLLPKTFAIQMTRVTAATGLRRCPSVVAVIGAAGLPAVDFDRERIDGRRALRDLAVGARGRLVPPAGTRPYEEYMAYLRKPTNSENWHIVHHVAGRRREWSTRTRNHGLAKRLLKKFEYDRMIGRKTRPTETPVPGALEKYAAHLRQQSGRTRKKRPQTDLYRLATWFGPICSALQNNPSDPSSSKPKEGRRVRRGDPRHIQPLRIVLVEEITTPMVWDWLATLARKRNLHGKTLNEYREILARFVAWAMRRGTRMPGNVNPVTNVDRFRVETKPIRFLTLAQIDEQINVLRDQPTLRIMVATLICTGLRLGELTWLGRQDVDLQRGYIAVRRKTVLGVTWVPKTGRDRSVPISSTLRAILAVYMAPESVPWFFHSPNGCRWDVDNFGAALRSANRARDLPWTAFDYRHTFGSQLAMNGMSLLKIAELLGNSPEICRRHCAALLPESLVDAVEFPARDATELRLRCREA